MKHFLLILALVFCEALQATPAKLTRGVDLSLVVEGRNVGSMKIPAGTEVDVVSVTGTNAVIKRGDSTYSVPASSLEIALAAVMATPSVIPSPRIVSMATPTPTPELASSPLEVAAPTLSPTPNRMQTLNAKEWHKTLEDATAVAREQNKLILIDLTEPDNRCPFCKLLNDFVLTNNTFLQYASEHVVLLRSVFESKSIHNAEDLKRLTPEDRQVMKLMETYHVHGFPTLLLIKPDGTEVSRHKGYPSINPLKQIIEWLKNSLNSNVG